MRIYADMVAILNFLIDFLLILGTNRLTGFPPSCARAAMASLLGGLYGGACLLPGFLFLGNAVWRIISLSLIAVIAFGWNRSTLRRGGIFLLLSMALGGIALGMGGGSVPILLLSALLMWLLCQIGFGGRIGEREYIPVSLRWNDREMTVIALKDTGNTLRDPLTGEQVLVAGADVGMKLLGLNEYQLKHPLETLVSGVLPGLRLIPYHAVGVDGAMMLAIRFTDARIGEKAAQPLVAFAPKRIARGEQYQMLTGGVI